MHEEKQKKMSKPNHVDHHNIIPNQILEDLSGFNSRAFLIRYCEEEVEINDIGLFRAEIDVDTDYLNTPFHMEMELFFSDLSAIGGPEKWQHQTVAEFEQKAVFKSVSKQRFLLKRLPQGISEYVSVVFDDQYFSSMSVVVQATLLDFRFRLKSFKTMQ
jgi:hypothetical protein